MAADDATHGSVTQWIEDLRNNDSDATRKIWGRFVERLIRVAERKLKNTSVRIASGETVASDAFKDFFRAGPDGFRKLVDRRDLWKILVMIAERRAIDAIRSEIRNPATRPGDEFDSLVCGSNPPDVEMLLIEVFEQRLGSLNGELLQKIAIGRMNGMTNREIAEANDTSLRNVERKLSIIRDKWKSEDVENC